MTSRVLRQHVAESVTQDSETPPTTCSSHYGQVLVGVCEEEELPVCSACAETKPHRGHTHISIPEAVSIYSLSLKSDVFIVELSSYNAWCGV